MNIKIEFSGPEGLEFLLRGPMCPRWAQRKARDLVKVMGKGSSAIVVDEETGDRMSVVVMGADDARGSK